MNFNPYVLIMAVFSLVAGLGLYIWLVRSNASYFYATNVMSWLLMALFPVLLIFSFFPESSFSSTIKGATMGGAIGAFLFIWWYGTRTARQAVEVDARIEKHRAQANELQGKLRAQEDELQLLNEEVEKYRKERVPSVLRECETFYYTLKGDQGKRIALITGNIQGVRVADIWANSENTNMQMSRFHERSISGIIRYLGAKKDIAGNVTEDIIANELAQIMGHNLFVQPATVLVTGAGELQRTHNVKRIFHLASVQSEVGVGYRPINNIENCITNALQKVDSEELRDLELKSILFPLLGTGTAKGNLKEIAERLVQAAISYMETTENSRIECVYFLTWTDIELETCRAILEESDRLGPRMETL
jgi:O-acetyl-ADP-ribose deacetylase (regulator of RNase III)